MRIITLAHTQTDEHHILRHLLEHSGVFIHIRKPNLSALEFARYVAKFTFEERQQLIAHQHFDIAKENGLAGIHLSTKLREDTTNKVSGLMVSTSTHSWSEFNALPSSFHMAFISPVFPSISKPGYGTENNVPFQERINRHTSAIALGGVSTLTIQRLRDSDFDDFALCGGFWQASDPLREAKECIQLYETANLY